jgi:hypothetical protein
MTNHPNRSNYRYFRVCPRGFANEVRYYKVPLDKIAEVDAEYANFEDNNPGASCGWTTDRKARVYGVAIPWEYRNW